MSGTRGGLGRIVAIGVALAMILLLLVAGEARAGRYAVAQCGWYVGADAGWADTTGGAKFRPDAYCVPPSGADPFGAAHLKSLTRDGQATVSGTQFARWRWMAPPGTGITQVHGTWWHVLHDGIEQRLGGVGADGSFQAFASAGATDTAPHEFTKGFPTPVAGFEDRLLCARGADKWCSLENPSWSALRALTLTVEDPIPPSAEYVMGELMSGGWHRGREAMHLIVRDTGAGVRYAETKLDGARVDLTEFPCEKALIGGEWRATRMQPCQSGANTVHFVNTAGFSDGPHTLVSCAIDFANNGNCAPARGILIDNNPPAHPKAPSLAGGDGWRRLDDFDLSWENPDQGQGSPILGASWRLLGSSGYDSGLKFAFGRGRKTLSDLSVPAAGEYSLQLWLRDEAGNEAPSSAITMPLRFDDVRPAVAFAAAEVENQIVAEVSDEHSGPDAGSIFYRRLDAERWTELPTKLLPDSAPGKAKFVAPMPELGYGTFVFRADAADGAGNTASTTLRADGTQMAVRRVPPPRVVKTKAKTRLFARLRGGPGRGDSMTVRFGATAQLTGRLTSADGAGLEGQDLRVVLRPSHGALDTTQVLRTHTGKDGAFELRLPPGTSRRVTVSFAGDDRLEPAQRAALELRVRSRISLRARPRSLSTGEAVHLSGRVASKSAPLPRRGKLIAIQYFERATKRWRPVLVTRSDHDGRFRAHYRFRYVSGQAAIRLRATALAEERWPYAPGSSRPVTVRVRG